ncbi:MULTISPECIES: hypothetical protein [unclassified Streptomyces]|uniref:hypothetical protein n=1 Tax=unclassified Streptomyces TaxID=2593676 RepID=UPI002E2D15EA|nr:hypothetical protein [Streptomyces sp. NBC_01429]
MRTFHSGVGDLGTGIGYLVWPAVSADGRTAVSVSVHSRPGDEGTAVRQLKGVTDLVDHAFCAERRDR